MLSLTHYESAHFKPLSFQLDQQQSLFTMNIEECIHQRKDLEDSDKTILTILWNATPVGFFILDKGPDRLEITTNPQSLLMRSFSINPDHQGKGFGKMAIDLAKRFILKNNSVIEELVLSVNVENSTAYQMYIKSGFQDTGNLLTGIRGPQHKLILKLS